MSALAAAALADFRERTRSFRFLAVLLATASFSMLMLPRLDAGYTVLDIGGARGVYGSAWVGLVFGVVAAIVLPLFGFFVIKDAVGRDRRGGVGLLLAATPLGRFSYVGAKFASNALLLGAVLAVSTLVAVAMQLWRGEDLQILPGALLLHLWAVALPSVLIVAALAVVFECLPGLRGAGGNIVFFFLWTSVLGVTFKGIEGEGGTIVQRRSDVFGISAPLADFERELLRVRPGHPGGLSIGAHIGSKPPQPLPWKGMGFDRQWLAARLGWTLLVLPLLGIAALGFDRFDPARKRQRMPAASGSGEAAEATPNGGAWHVLTAIEPTRPSWRPMAMLLAELRLLLWRQPWWWYAGFGGFWIAGLATPTSAALAWVVPLAWLWCVTLWSQLGARAEIHGTRALLWTAPAPVLRQLPVQWAAGTLLGLLIVVPVLMKLLLSGQAPLAAQVVVGAGFVAAASLAGGALSGGSRLFELAFLMLWYAAMNGAAGARFYGNADLSFAGGYALVYLGLATLLLAVAASVRWLALRR